MIEKDEEADFKNNGEALDFAIKKILETSADPFQKLLLTAMLGNDDMQFAFFNLAALFDTLFPTMLKHIQASHIKTEKVN